MPLPVIGLKSLYRDRALRHEWSILWSMRLQVWEEREEDGELLFAIYLQKVST